MERVRSGDLDACTSTEVLQEILCRYSALGRLDLGESVYDLFVALVPEVFAVTLADTDLAESLLLSIGDRAQGERCSRRPGVQTHRPGR